MLSVEVPKFVLQHSLFPVAVKASPVSVGAAIPLNGSSSHLMSDTDTATFARESFPKVESVKESAACTAHQVVGGAPPPASISDISFAAAGCAEEAAPEAPGVFYVSSCSPVGPQENPVTSVSISFSQPLVPLSRSYTVPRAVRRAITVLPSLPMPIKFKLSSPTDLTLQWADPLPAATRFTVSIAATLRSDGGGAALQPSGGRTFTFETSRPALKAASLAQPLPAVSRHAAPRPGDDSSVAAVTLFFDMPLKPGAALPRALAFVTPRAACDSDDSCCAGVSLSQVDPRGCRALEALAAAVRSGTLLDPATGAPMAVAVLDAWLTPAPPQPATDGGAADCDKHRCVVVVRAGGW